MAAVRNTGSEVTTDPPFDHKEKDLFFVDNKKTSTLWSLGNIVGMIARVTNSERKWYCCRANQVKSNQEKK